MLKHILLLSLTLFISFATYAQEGNTSHTQEEEEEPPFVRPDDNFSVHRLFITNDKGEVLTTNDSYTPSFIHVNRQYLTEALDSLAAAYGVNITQPKLRALLSYKYEYHDDATIRGFYTAEYVSGTPKAPKGLKDVKWMPLDELAQNVHVKSISDTMVKIFEEPNVVWGGSFMIWHKGDLHGSIVVEELYPLFKCE